MPVISPGPMSVVATKSGIHVTGCRWSSSGALATAVIRSLISTQWEARPSAGALKHYV